MGHLDLETMGRQARNAFKQISRAGSADRQAAVLAIARELEAGLGAVRAANELDIQQARRNGLSEALVDRLTLTPDRLAGMLTDLQALAELPDPVGEVYDVRELPSGITIRRQRVPLGVMGVIYESRPNVTIDVASLAVKIGNAAILRGGKETLNSNLALIGVIQSALDSCGLPREAIQFIDSPDRALVGEMLRLNDYVDIIVPRGGNGLHEFCRKNATIPVITGGIGICHLFVDSSADLERALPLIHNAKTQRPSVCNSLDTLLVHQEIAEGFLPRLVDYLGADGVSFKAESRAKALLGNGPVTGAGPADFDTEWLSLVLGLKVVSGIDEALEHINAHSTFHSDGILTADNAQAKRFIQDIDSAAVFVNASTRFNDGAQFGLGAEVAVSTQRLHARGPMGLPELTTYKWVVEGDYTVRA